MKVLRVEDYWVNQITITPFSWSEMIPTRLRDIKHHPASISGTWWKNSVFPLLKKFNLEAHHRIDPHICRSSYLSDKPWYLVTAQPWGSLLDFSWVRQCCEANLRWSAWWISPSMCRQLSFPTHRKFSISQTDPLVERSHNLHFGNATLHWRECLVRSQFMKEYVTQIEITDKERETKC